MTQSTPTHGSTLDVPLIERAEQTLRDHAARSINQLRELESEMVDMLSDHGTIQEDRDGTRRLIESVRADLTRTQRALHRIQIGTFGQCTACHQPIAPARLAAIPESERCSACA
ncbi:TraR/DksA family transcriptional regulator [Ilumatobacter sp.]|uniref:TraR/DksA family transcriptional regulator n=1 Tax=Ilumatobacter sp. TaxID=1967498 RepID=UPI003C531F39